MTEKLLHFIWQFQYFNPDHLQTTDGEPVTILYPGRLNANQGPDFLEARIKIGSTILAGSVELHLKTSDWQKHQHDEDPNYRNVVLHVVYQNDVSQTTLPLLELQPRISNLLLERYYSLMQNGSFIACEGSLTSVRELTWISWKERLLAERLTRKSGKLLEYLRQTNGHWEESFWWLLCRNLGGKVNAAAFEAIARSLPVTVLAKHKSSIHQLEALLLGQANLLFKESGDAYVQLLQREYAFLKKKYGLTPIGVPVYFLRMRPANFPTIRLAQLAMLVHQSSHLFSKVLEAEQLEELSRQLHVTANDYWHYRYRFDEPSEYKPKKLGSDTIDHIIINTFIPALFAYGHYHQKEQHKTKALNWLEQIRAEENVITKRFQKSNIANRSAYDSQALIELKNEYCNAKRCLECSIGNALLKKA